MMPPVVLEFTVSQWTWFTLRGTW